MKKWFQTFAALTVAIILVTGSFIWFNARNEVATLAYVPDSDWSDATRITPELKGTEFATVTDGQGHLHTLWLEYQPPFGAVDIMHYSVDTRGKKQGKPQLLAHNDYLKAFTITYSNERLHAFYVGEGEPGQYGLFYVQMNPAGEILHNQKVKSNLFTAVADLQAHPAPDGTLMLVWSDEVDQIRQVFTMIVSPEGRALGEATQVTFTDSDSRTAKLLIDAKHRYHLTWREEYAYEYELFYQQLTEDGASASTPRLIDQVSVNPASMGVTGDSLYLVWTKRMNTVSRRISIIEKSFPNYELFGTIIDLNHPEEELQIQRLTSQNGPSFEHTMGIDPEGKVHLVYIDTYHNHLGLTHRVFNGDFLAEDKEARRLYPNQVNGSATTLVTDQDGQFHLFWLEANHESGHVYYANTIHQQTTNALQVVGINSGNYTVSIVMSLFYLLAVPLFYMLLHLHWGPLLILPSFVNNSCDALSSRFNFGNVVKHPMFKVALACLLQVLIYLAFGRAAWLFGQGMPTPAQIWFILTVASIATLGLAGMTHKQFYKFGASKVGLYAATFVFWVHLISLTYNLPMINFYFDMIDLAALFGL